MATVRRLSLFLVALMPALWEGEALAAKVQLTDDAFIDLRAFVQAQAVFAENGAADGGLGTDFLIRRARIILGGQVHPMVKFFIETDSPNLGKNGDWSPTIFIQDAYVDFDLDPRLKIAGGMILLPFSHNSRQGAATLNTLDYHTALIKFPAGTTKVWRDAGVEARGLLSDNHLDYRIGVFNGMPTKIERDPATKEITKQTNPDDWPRFTGRLQLNVLDAEESFFYNGIYFGKKKIVSFGIGYDLSPDIAQDKRTVHSPDPNDPAQTVTTTQVTNALYWAMAGDVFIDLPVGEDEVIVQVNVLHWNEGENQATTGTGFAIDAGYRIGKIEPKISGEWFDADDSSGDLRNVRVGINYWIKEHAANLKGEWGYASPTDDIADGRSVFTIQAQILL